MRKILITIIGGILALSSCTKNKQSTALTYTPSQIQNYLETLSTQVVYLMQFPEFRTKLKAEALLQLDGDYDVLYTQISTFLLNNGQTVDQFLNTRSEDVINFVRLHPNLQLSIPVNIEDWNTATFIPNVAAMPYGIDESELDEIYSINSNTLEVEMLPSATDPLVPVVVIGISERYDETGALLPDFVNAENSNRVSGCNEKIDKIKCPNLGTIEAWTSGAPELRLKIYGYYANSTQQPNPVLGSGMEITSQFFKPSKRKDIDNKFVTFNRNLFFWYTDPNISPNVHSSALKFVWVEEDYFVNGNGKDISISGSVPLKVKILGQEVSVAPTLNLTWHINNDDDDCGNNLVQFQDPINNNYNTGFIEWIEAN